jgi:hypothetical protein
VNESGPNGHDPWSVAGDVGQAGLRAAGAVVEQLLALSRRLTDVPMPISTFEPSPAGTAGPAQELRRLRADAERLIELYGDWTRALLDGFTELAEGRGGTDRLVAGPVAAGTGATTTAWLHLLDGAGIPEAPLFATDLVAHDGVVLAGTAVSFDPSTLGARAHTSDTAAPGERTAGPTEVRVTVTVPAGAAPGTYHGTVLATGLPEVHLALRVDVVA